MSSHQTKKLTYISLFSGIEAASVAWEPLGFEPIAFSEIDSFSSAVLKERYPHVPNLGDITKINNWSEYRGKVDIVVGGSPCQSFSLAGKREGLKGESGLMFEYIRAIREIRPRYFVWENVPGALSSEKGEAFRQLLSKVDELGYSLAWRVFNAMFFGVPHKRRRVFLVGSLRECAAEILFEPESLLGSPESNREVRETFAHRTRNSIEGSCERPVAYTLQVRCGKAGGGKGPLIQENMSATLSTSQTQTLFQPISEVRLAAEAAPIDDTEKHNKQQDKSKKYIVRKLTPLECERLQGFPDNWTRISYKGKAPEDCPDSPRYKALGNSMAVPVMKWIGERLQMVDELT